MVGNSYPPFATSFLSFHASFPFATSFLSLLLFPSIRYFLPFVSTPSFRSSFPPFNASLPFLTLFLSFQTLPFHSVLPSFRFNPYIPFVAASLRLKLFIFVASFLPFQLNVCHFFPFVSTLPFRSVTPSIQLFPFIRYFLFVSPLPFHLLLPSFRFNSSRSFVLAFYSLQIFLSFHLWPFLSLQFSPYIRYFLPFVSSGYLRPLEWLQVAASGRKTTCSSRS